MKKLYGSLFLCAFVLSGYNLYAEETQGAAVPTPVDTEPAADPTQDAAPAVASDTQTAPAESQPAPAESQPAPAVPAASEAQPAAPAATPETINTENLEFVSGEVTAMDEASKTLTLKLYGETENDTEQKVLSVHVDETTDITDGEKDRDMKSLAAGTEVDVEYDPASNKATYIFVY